jgi:ribonuclease M5
MEEKLKIRYPVIVEGKYDRLRLLSVMEGQILTTEGFGIFKQKEKLALLRALAQKTPLIVLTDPDGAGKLIRSHIGSAVPKDRLIPLYVPQIAGKEKRKAALSAEGFLGVEGQEHALLYDLLAPFAGEQPVREAITKTDLFEYGLTGAQNSAARRDALARAFALPAGMTPNALLAALNVIATREEFVAAVTALAE